MYCNCCVICHQKNPCDSVLKHGECDHLCECNDIDRDETAEFEDWYEDD